MQRAADDRHTFPPFPRIRCPLHHREISLSTSLLPQLLLLTALTSPVTDSDAFELRYQGTLTETGRESNGETVKRFNLYCFGSRSGDGGQRLTFLLDERGGGSWPWPERYGSIQLNQQLKPTNPTQIRLLYTHEGKPTSIRLRRPLFEHRDKLAPNAAFKVGQVEYRVSGSSKFKEMDCWDVESVTNFGLREKLTVEKSSGLIVRGSRELTRGRGVPFSLAWELQSALPLDKPAQEKLQPAVDTLLKLQTDLQRPENAMQPELTAEQLKTAEAVADQLKQQAEETPFARLAAAIRRDIKLQSRRDDDVEKLAGKFVGQSAPELSLTTIGNKNVDPGSFDGNVVVLHFWSYKSDPLEEPYGQAAYLDFSYSRYKKLGVQVFGVAVNNGLADAATRGGALQSARKFKNFMNLSYPIAFDGGELIAKFGDPRRVGAKLPLWVVIGADGKITHYKLGYYKINPDEGLRPLDKAVGLAVRAKRKAGGQSSK